MFLLDSLMIDGISWVLRTVTTAAEAEMNDDTALREQLLAAEMQRELGEITDEEFAGIERDLLTRIREIKERREGGSGPLELGAGRPIETDEESRFQIEATVSGEFHEPADAPHTTIVEQVPSTHGIFGTEGGQVEQVLDIEPVDAVTIEEPALPLPTRKPAATRTKRSSKRTTRTPRTPRTIRTSRTRRTTRTSKIR
jgi:gas vesicle protein GvpG